MMEEGAMTGCGSAPLEDRVFLKEFESCRFPADRFRHADHIRLAWIYLRQEEYGVAEERLRTSIQRFARHAGAGTKYHETMTIAWMRLVDAAVHLSSRFERFADFAGAHAWLLRKDAVFEFYSPARLMSDAARKSWVEPDCKPLPLPTGNKPFAPCDGGSNRLRA
jgi:hypothetical protein